MSLDQCQLFNISISMERTLALLHARALLKRVLWSWPKNCPMSQRFFRSTQRLLYIFKLTALRGSLQYNDKPCTAGRSLTPWLLVLEYVIKRLSFFCLRQADSPGASALRSLSSEFCAYCLYTLRCAAFKESIQEIRWLYRDLKPSDAGVIFRPNTERAAWLLQLMLDSSFPGVCTPYSLCQLASYLESRNMSLKEMVMRLMTTLLCKWCMASKQISPTTSAISMICLHEVIVISDIQVQLRSDVQKRIDFERRQRRLHFSAYVLAAVELLNSFSNIEAIFLQAMPQNRDNNSTAPNSPSLKCAAKDSLHLVWAPLPVHKCHYKLEIADQIYGVPKTDFPFRVVYRGLHASAIINGLVPARTYFFRVGLEEQFLELPPICSHLNDSGPVVSFRTLRAPPFTFDSLNKGPAISLNRDGLNASFCANETWATVLGSVPFISSCNSWELEIISSTSIYLFVGVATRQTNLATFLGGDEHSWGYIGDRALYHKRTKMKLYGERFGHGDTIGILLNMEDGVLSFSKNGTDLGVAFEGLVGALYPAVAFYNAGQHVALVENSFKCPGAGDMLAHSNSTFNFDQAAGAFDLMFSMLGQKRMGAGTIRRAHRQCQSWLRSSTRRVRSSCGFDVHVKRVIDPSTNLCLGQYVRTPRGNASVLGSAFGLIWFDFRTYSGAWFYTRATIRRGVSSGYFRTVPCSPVTRHPTGLCVHAEYCNDITIAEFYDSLKTQAPDANLNKLVVREINKVSQLCEQNAWNLEAAVLMSHLNSEILYNNTSLTKQVLCCQVSLILLLNNDILRGFPFLVKSVHTTETAKHGPLAEECYCSNLALLRGSILKGTKQTLFKLFSVHTTTHAKRAEDDYDYPDDLPQVVINRLKATISPMKDNLEASYK